MSTPASASCPAAPLPQPRQQIIDRPGSVVEPEEWEVFRAVNRDRGDALLAIAWNPDAPPGW